MLRVSEHSNDPSTSFSWLSVRLLLPFTCTVPSCKCIPHSRHRVSIAGIANEQFDTWARLYNNTNACIGLRALMKRDAEALKNLASREEVDVLCIQEHKLQEKHVEDLQEQVLGTMEGWDVSWSCSTAKPGYSGTAILYRKAAFPEQPTFTHGINVEEHDAEGRVVTMNLPSMYIVNVYVPNSGEVP